MPPRRETCAPSTVMPVTLRGAVTAFDRGDSAAAVSQRGRGQGRLSTTFADSSGARNQVTSSRNCCQSRIARIIAVSPSRPYSDRPLSVVRVPSRHRKTFCERPSTVGASIVGGLPQIPEVGNGKMSRRDEASQVTIGHHPDVLNDLLRWRWLAIAVVPRQFEQFESIQGCVCLRSKEFDRALLPRVPSVGSVRHHAGILPSVRPDSRHVAVRHQLLGGQSQPRRPAGVQRRARVADRG